MTDILFYVAMAFLFAASLNFAIWIASLARHHAGDDDWDDPA
ncbi:MAG TPA: hypothetical protein VKE95_05605 [Burkholderiales bacterium]|nr:hypothetical protein [Burkholderiales bacterium]